MAMEPLVTCWLIVWRACSVVWIFFWSLWLTGVLSCSLSAAQHGAESQCSVPRRTAALCTPCVVLLVMGSVGCMGAALGGGGAVGYGALGYVLDGGVLVLVVGLVGGSGCTVACCAGVCWFWALCCWGEWHLTKGVTVPGALVHGTVLSVFWSGWKTSPWVILSVELMRGDHNLPLQASGMFEGVNPIRTMRKKKQNSSKQRDTNSQPAAGAIFPYDPLISDMQLRHNQL